MAAYIIVDINVNEPKEYETYKKLTTGTLANYGGRFIVRGGQIENIEGDWQPERVVVLEFPSVEKAKAWWGSPEYAQAKAIRQRTAVTKMILVEGV
jgi:uncharacterized protein (DUF1330 family)